MRISRIFVNRPLRSGSEAWLDADAAHHLRRVLRLRTGARLRVFGPDGVEYEATLLSASKKGAQIEVGAATGIQTESPVTTTLVQAVSRGERMDMVMQKATELGVTHLLPLFSERSVVKLPPERLAKRVGHWQRIAVHACEQCGRTQVPQVQQPQGFAEWIGQQDAASTRLFLQPDSNQAMPDIDKPADHDIVLAIGPEGGWSAGERESMISSGFIGVSLGPRILRTETAALVALALVQARWGDLS